MEVMDMPYGDRQGGIRDVAGNIWWLSQRIVKAPYTG
jgi:PhnB protein